MTANEGLSRPDTWQAGDVEAALYAAWDDGNATGLDGWVGPERGEEPDEHAIVQRREWVEKRLAAVSRLSPRTDAEACTCAHRHRDPNCVVHRPLRTDAEDGEVEGLDEAAGNREVRDLLALVHAGELANHLLCVHDNALGRPMDPWSEVAKEVWLLVEEVRRLQRALAAPVSPALVGDVDAAAVLCKIRSVLDGYYHRVSHTSMVSDDEQVASAAFDTLTEIEHTMPHLSPRPAPVADREGVAG